MMTRTPTPLCTCVVCVQHQDGRRVVSVQQGGRAREGREREGRVREEKVVVVVML